MPSSHSCHRRPRLTLWVGTTYLLLFLLGPWVHEHVHSDHSNESEGRAHHAHSFAAVDQDIASHTDHDDVPLGSHGPDSDTGHSVDGRDGVTDMVFQSNRSARAPDSLRSLLLQLPVCLAVVADTDAAHICDKPPAEPAQVPRTSGQIALHQGTDVSPPRT